MFKRFLAWWNTNERGVVHTTVTKLGETHSCIIWESGLTLWVAKLSDAFIANPRRFKLEELSGIHNGKYKFTDTETNVEWVVSICPVSGLILHTKGKLKKFSTDYTTYNDKVWMRTLVQNYCTNRRNTVEQKLKDRKIKRLNKIYGAM